jgi:hypothetical protein
MKLLTGLLILSSFTLATCSSPSDSTPTDQIIGSYTVENTFEVPDIYSSNEKILGIGKIRDTIFIKAKQKGFEVTNSMWRLNEYDMKGWQNLEHSENHPMRTYGVSYDATDSSLNSDPLGFMPSLYLDFNSGKLYKGKDRKRAYVKVNKKY